MTTPLSCPSVWETFGTERWVPQQQARPPPMASYRDTCCLLWRFAQQRLHPAPSALTLADLAAPVIGSFRAYREPERGTSARSRNARLAAIHAFFHQAALHVPSPRGVSPRVLALPSQRDDRTPIAFVTGTEIDARVAAPAQLTWAGRRDRTLRLVTVQTGRRVSELIGLCGQDITWGLGAHVRCPGKGRTVRCIPRRQDALSALRTGPREQQRGPEAPMFPNARGGPRSRDGVAYLLANHVATAQPRCPS